MKIDYDFTIYEYLRKKLKLCRITTDKSETQIRCPFCGDSENINHAHLYINNNPPFKYYCQKCSTSGIVTDKFLKSLDLYDPEVISFVNKNYKKYLKNLNKKYGNNFLDNFKKEFNVLPNQFTKLEKLKLKYINDRLGIKINTKGLIKKYKIILNLKDFFAKNNLKMNEFYKDNLKKLNTYYVGFLLNDNNQICFRDITNKQPERYINKKIYSENIIQSRKFYTIENKIDLSSEVFNLYLAEGIFDIIGIYNHIYDCNQNSNDLFISCNGKSYNFVLNYLKSLGILNCNINIYSDKDVSLKKLGELVNKNILTKFNGYNVYYNTIGKDYGVRKDEIILSEPEEV